jgi:hypothetical protein
MTGPRRWLSVIAVSASAAVIATGSAQAADCDTDKVIELRADKIAIGDDVIGGLDSQGAAELAVPLTVVPAKLTRPANGSAAADLAAPRPDQLEARLALAMFGHAPMKGAPFRARLAPTDDKQRWQLMVGLDAATVARPGSYTLLIDLVRTATGDVVQTLSLTLERPVAELRAIPSTIAIDQVQALPHDITALDDDVRVVIEETTGLARAAFTAADTRRAEAGGERVAAGMTLGSGAGAIAAGAAQPLAIVLTGAFPAGTTTGAIELRSAQASRVEIAYQVRTRVGWPAIVGFLIAGWLGGLGVRIGLQWYVKRRYALDQLAEIEDQAIALGQAIADPRLGAPAVIAACAAARKDWRTVSAALPRLRTRLDEVKARFQPILETVRARAAAFTKAVTPEWRLPADIAGALTGLRQTAADLNRELAVGNASAATQLLDGAFNGAVAALYKRVEAWRTSSLTTAAMLETSPTLATWPAPVSPIATDAAARWRSLVMSAPTEKPGDSDALAAMLRAIHTVEVSLAAAASALITSWRIVIDACAAELASLPGKPLTGLTGKLPEIASAEVTLAKLSAVAKSITDDFKTTVLGLVPPDDPSRKQLEARIAEGAWMSAAELVRKLTVPTDEPVVRIRRTSGAHAAQPGPVTSRTVTAVSIDPVTPPLPAIGAAPTAARLPRSLDLPAATPSSVFSAGLLVILYAVHFSTTPAATWLDLIGTAVQAGSVDLGIAVIATIARNLLKT